MKKEKKKARPHLTQFTFPKTLLATSLPLLPSWGFGLKLLFSLAQFSPQAVGHLAHHTNLWPLVTLSSESPKYYL